MCLDDRCIQIDGDCTQIACNYNFEIKDRFFQVLDSYTQIDCYNWPETVTDYYISFHPCTQIMVDYNFKIKKVIKALRVFGCRYRRYLEI